MPAPSPLLILGGGPTGLGAAWRLHELGRTDWTLLEAAAHPGGLASSFRDEQGFTWDIGGHVQFSHYRYFDGVMQHLLGADGWLHHQRESWVWIGGRFVPYPLQNNLHRLPPADLEKCLRGLEEIAAQPHPRPGNFREWILATMGAGIAEIFLLPYNFKVWAYPPELMNAVWVGERVSVPDLDRIRRNVAAQADDVSWGPNNTFQFPKRGGTGAIWRACGERLPQDRLQLKTRVTGIDLSRHTVRTADGRSFAYDRLITTLPLLELLRLTGQTQFHEQARAGLLYSSSHIIGLGLRGRPGPELATKCWIYFPETNCPFYRGTIFSNYSPHNVPDSERNWSLMFEVSESPCKPVNPDTLLEETIQGAMAARLIGSREEIVSTWTYRAPYGYPTPGLQRDAALAEIIPFFERQEVYSRGRFGLWKYEVSNQDHSFMQGVEIVERLLHGRPEVTARDPNFANSKKHPWPFESWSPLPGR